VKCGVFGGGISAFRISVVWKIEEVVTLESIISNSQFVKS
jgi:hypothetical protein